MEISNDIKEWLSPAELKRLAVSQLWLGIAESSRVASRAAKIGNPKDIAFCESQAREKIEEFLRLIEEARKEP